MLKPQVVLKALLSTKLLYLDGLSTLQSTAAITNSQSEDLVSEIVNKKDFTEWIY